MSNYFLTTVEPNFRNKQPKKFPKISQPSIFGYFSVDKDRNFIPDASNLKYLRLPTEPNLRLNLNEGFEIRQTKPESAKNEKLDHLLKYILLNMDKLQNKMPQNIRKLLDPDFVCFRGLLRLIMCSPYEYKTNWIILATRFRDTIYLCAKETEEKKFENLNQSWQSRLFCSYGFKFEQFILTDDPKTAPNTDVPVYEGEEFCTIYRTILDNKVLLYGAEMDGMIRDEKLKDFEVFPESLDREWFAEVKVTNMSTQRQRDNVYKFKARNWWCQCFLVNIRKIVVGKRDDNGIVEEIEEMDLKELQKKCEHYWTPVTCMHFCNNLLNSIQDIMKGVESESIVYEFEYDSKRSPWVTYRIHDDNSESFLPKWYYDEINKYKSPE